MRCSLSSSAVPTISIASHLNGPEPIGLLVLKSTDRICSGATFPSTCFGIIPFTIEYGNALKILGSVKVTVFLSIAATLIPCQLLASGDLVSGFCIVLYVKTTSSAVNGFPSCHSRLSFSKTV